MDIETTARRFFERLGQNPQAREALRDFDGWLVLRIGGSPYAVRVSRGAVGDLQPGDMSIGRSDLQLEGDAEIFRDIFEGRASPALAFNFGYLKTPGGKARENLICAAFRAMRAAQTPPQRDLLAELTAQKATATICCQVCGFQTDNRTAMEAHLLNHTTVE